MTENRNREGLKNCTSLKVDMSTIPLTKVSSYVGKDTSNQSVEDLRYSYTINSAHLHSTTVSKFPPQVTAMWLLSLSFWILLYIWLVWKIWNLMRLEWTKKESPVFHLLSPFFSSFATPQIAFISVCIHISIFSGPEQSGELVNEPGARPTYLQRICEHGDTELLWVPAQGLRSNNETRVGRVRASCQTPLPTRWVSRVTESPVQTSSSCKNKAIMGKGTNSEPCASTWPFSRHISKDPERWPVWVALWLLCSPLDLSSKLKSWWWWQGRRPSAPFPGCWQVNKCGPELREGGQAFSTSSDGFWPQQVLGGDGQQGTWGGESSTPW